MDWWQIEQPQIIRVRCAAHVINLVCQEGVKELQDTTTVVREYAKTLGHDKAFSHFQKIQKKQRPKREAIRVPLDVTTRWNSTYMMLNVALTFRSSLDEFSRTYRNMDEYQMNDFQWDEVEMFVSLLKPLYEATLELSRKKNPLCRRSFQ
ncbi:hypothetical protein RvY_16296 [Ramazzottius varieornatus]|uniref:hAT-like transposase RNase-H fold domain-containing protein n=1 Tax=Ramazzottius varieornatus TaxID=947166 RepID=A0A1D1W5M0_RAMVA|nr:hypothetical protein RvY_16296 [Ramazzottius varieornatus]